jgi:hypothetical protein
MKAMLSPCLSCLTGVCDACNTRDVEEHSDTELATRNALTTSVASSTALSLVSQWYESLESRLASLPDSIPMTDDLKLQHGIADAVTHLLTDQPQDAVPFRDEIIAELSRRLKRYQGWELRGALIASQTDGSDEAAAAVEAAIGAGEASEWFEAVSDCAERVRERFGQR